MMNDHAYSVMSGDVSSNEKSRASWLKFDEIISKFLIEQNVPGAVIAVSKNGEFLHKQGYGIAGGSKRVQTDSLFRIASISKPITSIAVQRLCEQYQLSLDSKVFGKKGILKKSGKYRDKRVSSITLRHLLQHSAGWDRDKVGDAVFVRPQCVINHHPDSSDFNSALLKYALRRRLQFTPGSQHAYSNLGYLILGMVIEEVSGQPYHVFMSKCLQQSGVTGIQLGSWKRAAWSSNEVEYFNNREPELVNSLFPGYGEVLPQYGGMAVASSGSYGGLVSNTHSLLTFLHKMSCAYTGDESRVEKKECSGWMGNDGCITDKLVECSADNTKIGSSSSCGINEGVQLRESTSLYYQETNSSFSLPWDLSASDSSMTCCPELSSDTNINNVQTVRKDSNSIDCDCYYAQNLCSDEFAHCSRYLCLNLAGYENVIENGTKDVASSFNKNTVTFISEHYTKSVFSADVQEQREMTDRCINRPLLTQDQIVNSFRRPTYEDGPDWYGLGWDVEDNGQSWGHTGAMEGTCGTMYHHTSGVDWVFLLNSWALDDDLNGVMKCALSTVPDLSLFHSLISSNLHGCCVKIKSRNEQQVIFLDLCEACVQTSVCSMKDCGYFLTWISTLSQNIIEGGRFTKPARVSPQIVALSFVLMFSKVEKITDYAVVCNVTETDLRKCIKVKEQAGYLISFLDSFSLKDELRFSAVFQLRKEQNCPRMIFLSLKATAYVKQIKQFVKSHFIKTQSVTQIRDHMIVNVILEERSKSSNSNSSLETMIYWVQITPESFLAELKRQISKSNGLTYVKFFTVNHKAYVSGCWSSTQTGNTFHRMSLSKYGLVPELAEAAAKNIVLQSISEFEEDGLVHYAAFWFAG